MASFTTAAKDEILSNRAVRQHYRDQQSFGLMVFSREFSAAKMQMLTRERRAAQYYAQLVQSVRPLAGTVTLREEKLSTGQLAYRVSVDDMADRIELYNHFAMLYPEGVTFELLGGDEGAGAFVGGVFLACGTLSDPETKYHLEFAVPRPEVLMMFVELLQGVGFQPLLTQRRGQTIVYLHDSTQIEDLLTFMGCPLTSMEIMNAKIIKERRNAANRASNCDTANMDKVAGAAAQQIAAIRAVGLESLPEELRALARLRLENPFDSLRELGEKLPRRCPVPVSTTGWKKYWSLPPERTESPSTAMLRCRRVTRLPPPSILSTIKSSSGPSIFSALRWPRRLFFRRCCWAPERNTGCFRAGSCCTWRSAPSPSFSTSPCTS